jgi:hypothetical protein
MSNEGHPLGRCPECEAVLVTRGGRRVTLLSCPRMALPDGYEFVLPHEFQPAAGPWVSTDERLPDGALGDGFLVRLDDGAGQSFYELGFWDGHHFALVGRGTPIRGTHWAPINPPREETKP